MRHAGTAAQRLAVVLLALAVLTGCDPGSPTQPGPSGRAGCSGIDFDEVQGQRPTYLEPKLSSFPGSDALCAGYWVPGASHLFTPQAFSVDTDRIFVVGYRFRGPAGQGYCELMELNRRTGHLVRRISRLAAVVPGQPTYCHHGGGLVLNHYGLWVMETRRLWLLDPDKVSTGDDPVRRTWAVTFPLRGSFMLGGQGEFGMGHWRHGRRIGGVSWFRYDDILRSGVTELVPRAVSLRQTSPTRRQRGIVGTQGGALGPGGLYLSASNTLCGVIRLPNKKLVAAPPGAEDIGFYGKHGEDLWVLSESAAKPYQDQGGRPVVPMIGRYDAKAILSGPEPSCHP